MTARTPAEVAAATVPSVQDMLADIYTWMCEPDCTDKPTVDWLKDWAMRRPVADLAMVAMLMPAAARPEHDGGGLR